ncbi:Myb-like dna-binding protein [Globisporangium polare]
MMHHHYYQHAQTDSVYYSPPSTPTSSIASMPSSPTCSERRGDIHSGSLTRGLWSETEHEQFLDAMKMFPKGPWRAIAAFVGTRSIKQVQTHAQKYQQKIKRRQRGLRKQKKKLVRPEHRVDALASGRIIRSKSSSASSQSVPLSPRSPGGFVRTHSRKSSAGVLADMTMLDLLSDATFHDLLALGDESSKDDLDSLLEGIEPFPFTDVPYQRLFAHDDRYQQDLLESVDLLLA